MSADAAVGPDAEVDARGQRCPLPVIRLARAAADLGPGALVRVLATDPAAATDVPAFCRMRGHALVATQDAGDGATAYDVRVGG
ncbi:sulfurtransferase TusA family protein [Lapillicoccus jejuensis]|uniref:tRNA 2-thiouridine synthesizing protein A n=1 Tax=Lapillicoccus jejuensis TaxID=402171 RepID=A0A542E5Q0_9MICO|nr:sulfurtransferase TusA family protein [Lapillicoccus jejuensis]TQJ10663.1 tRNA 2-thiouridine synthesizing protein A [Lapillicoccus jejuensis]